MLAWGEVDELFANFAWYEVSKWVPTLVLAGYSRSRRMVYRFHQLMVNSNEFQPSNFKNSCLLIHSSNLSDLCLIGNLLKESRSLMLNSKLEYIVFKAEFLVERKPGVFTNLA